MKMLILNRKITVSILTMLLLISGLQSNSYSQGGPPAVTPTENNTSLIVSFRDTFYAYDEKSYQFQLRRKTPQGDWILKCRTIEEVRRIRILTVAVIFTGLEPGTIYEARYRETNQPHCTDNPPNPDPWSMIMEGKTLLENATRVEFSDLSLAIGVRRALGLAFGDGVENLKIPKAQLTKLTRLSITEGPVADLTGLDHAIQLRELHAWGITDITPLAQLTQLRELDLGGEIVDITPLSQLTQLRELGLSSNDITDITPLSQLTQLRELRLSFNDITDITPLSQLTQLTKLSLEGNQINDLTPLSQLTRLTLLGLTTNEVGDITPLAQLKRLRLLYCGYNQISDLTPLAQAEALTKLHLDHNHIQDLTPLTSLTRLTTLDLASNRIIDITPLSQLAESLMDLDLRDNRIRDVTPLADLKYVERLSLRDNPITDTFPLSSLLDMDPNLNIDIEVIREQGGPTITVTTPQRLTAATLNGSVVTLKLSSGSFDHRRSRIRDAITTSGITGITFHWSDIEKVSDTEARIALTFDGNIDTDTTLIITIGPGAIKNYNGPAFTTEVPISASTGAAAPGNVSGTPRLNISTPASLTEATLDERVVALTLSGGVTYHSNWNYVSQNVAVSGVPGVTFRRHNVKRVSDTRVTVQLEFNGNVNTDSTLTFTVGTKAIENYDGPAFTAEIPVSAGR